jgi:DNA-binding transcriptional LysR family regulator
VALQDLAALPFILRERGSGTRMAVDAHFKQARFKPDLRLELGSNEAIKEAVAGNLGIAVLSSHALHSQKAEHGVSVVNVEGFPLQSQWHVVRPRGKPWSPIARVFQQHLMAQAGGRSGP